MTWYEWVVGCWQFVVAWWGVDWTLRGRKRPEAIERRRVRHEARKQQEITRRQNYCTSCNAMLWQSPPGLCRRCRSVERENGKPPRPPDFVLRNHIAALDQIAIDTIKFDKERKAFETERASYYARNPRPPSGPGLVIRGNINRQSRWGG